jgi:hypothetical protein
VRGARTHEIKNTRLKQWTGFDYEKENVKSREQEQEGTVCVLANVFFNRFTCIEQGSSRENNEHLVVKKFSALHGTPLFVAVFKRNYNLFYPKPV